MYQTGIFRSGNFFPNDDEEMISQRNLVMASLDRLFMTLVRDFGDRRSRNESTMAFHEIDFAERNLRRRFVDISSQAIVAQSPMFDLIQLWNLASRRIRAIFLLIAANKEGRARNHPQTYQQLQTELDQVCILIEYFSQSVPDDPFEIWCDRLRELAQRIITSPRRG